VDTLQISPDASLAVHAAATLILIAHVGGGAVGLISGAVALAVRKGARMHRAAGNVFFGSMIAMAATGAAVAPFLESAQGDGKRLDSIAGIFVCYLVATAWMTVRRPPGSIGRFDIVACAIATCTTAAAFSFGLQARNSPSGLIGGFPAALYVAFGTPLALAAALDLKMIVRGGVDGASRVARHLWRMCAALFIAAASFFLGQQQVMPVAIQGSSVLFVPPILTVVLMAFWLVRVQRVRWITA
jgi:uncharacterized membrane protein